MVSVATGNKVAEGKTKIIWDVEGNPSLAVVESKDDITAGDGAKHDVMVGKAGLANATTCNVFRLLQACGIPLAFQKQIDERRFLAKKCRMVLLEVVVRREAHGSFLKRHPYLKRGHVFPRLLLEFFLKTTGRQWAGQSIPKDDPFMQIKGNTAALFLPDQPLYAQEPFLVLDAFPLSDATERYQDMGAMALKTFLVLEKAWQNLGRRLVDFKVEFGLTQEGELVLADVIDNDSWRVVQDDQYIDKQVYRDGGSLALVQDRYEQVAALTGRFTLPRQRLIVWRGSESDAINDFGNAIDLMRKGGDGSAEVVTRSLHKQPVQALQKLWALVQEVPDCVVIAYIGRSNGAGPTLSANTTVPVITVPASFEEFQEDVWSSLRTPSSTPVLTVLDPKNAALAALQILALRNPRLHAELRMEQEKRLANVVEI